MNKPRINFWSLPGVLLIHGETLDAQLHSHHAIQVVIADPNHHAELALSSTEPHQQIASGFVIGAKVPHQLRLTSGWILLIAPETELGAALHDYLLAQEAFTLAITQATQQLRSLARQASTAQCHQLLSDLLAEFMITDNQSTDNQSTSLNKKLRQLSLHAQCVNTISDARIAKLITQFDACYLEDCIKPEQWRASEVAQSLHLSESRFLHLFKAELGIPWRPYLLWRRLLCACEALAKGNSATEAALIAGFSDSAHLSRTFKAMFGVTIRELLPPHGVSEI